MRKVTIIAAIMVLAILAISLTACGTIGNDGDSSSNAGIGSGGGLVEPPNSEPEGGLVCFDPNGGTVSIAQKRYKIGSAMTGMPVPSRAGYYFVGWQTTNGKIYTSESFMPNLGGVTLYLYAKWIAWDKMSNFDFIARSDGFKITGIKDKTATSIVVPDSVTSIGERAFEGCSSLTSVIISDSVTNIGSGAFSGCASLESITIPFVGAKAGVTSSDTYQYPFGYIFGEDSYTGGTAVRQRYDGSMETLMHGTTYYIPSSLRSVTITGGNILRGAFDNCSMLTDITILDGVIDIGAAAFACCTGITSVNIPDSVTSIGSGAFSKCSSLTSVVFGENSQLNSIGGYAFNCCNSITNITIPDSVTTIGTYAFYECTSLTSITIPDRVTSIGEFAFYNCTSLTSITFGENSQLTSIGAYAFSYCTGLTSITIPNRVTSIADDAFSYCSNLTSIIIPNSVTSIGYGAFNHCISLTNITIPTSVTSIGVSAFNNCISLTSITIPDRVTSIADNAFSYCSNLTSVTFGEDSQLKSIGVNAFSYCTSLTSITIPDRVTGIGGHAFYYCMSLRDVYYLGNLVGWCGISFGDEHANPMYWSADWHIDGKRVEGELVIPDTVANIRSYAFYGCSGLTSITIPSSVTSIGWYAFAHCSNLTSVTFGENSQLTTIGKKTFYNCTSLTNIVIPDSVTKIGEETFTNCGFTSITIPDSVTSIGSYAFNGCTGLTSVTFEDPNGWCVSNNSGITTEINLTLTDGSTNAKYLTMSYRRYYWYKL